MVFPCSTRVVSKTSQDVAMEQKYYHSQPTKCSHQGAQFHSTITHDLVDGRITEKYPDWTISRQGSTFLDGGVTITQPREALRHEPLDRCQKPRKRVRTVVLHSYFPRLNRNLQRVCIIVVHIGVWLGRSA